MISNWSRALRPRLVMQRSVWLASLLLVAAWSLTVFSSGAAAAEEVIEEVIVTGSYIRGTPEDAALPVDVISSQDMLDRGNPSALDLIRAMPYVTSIMGETNQFGPNQGTIGTGNINLRGLGGMRTLVLMNGRRTTYTPAEGPAGVDTNLLPLKAIGRIEVLKDGAAAIYGSDAIAGVVNFITRRDLDGLELGGEFREIDDSDGDWNWHASWGWQGDRSNVLLSYAQQQRSELQSIDRDWAVEPYLVNPTGWSAFSDPGNFLPYSGGDAVANFTADANCNELGGYLDALPAAFAGPACRFSYIPFDNVVDKTEKQQAYGEINTFIADGVELHIEGLYSETRLPEYRTSPSYPPTSGPDGPGAFQMSVFDNPNGPSQFSNNPGALAALQQSGLSQGVIDATDQMLLGFWRPQGWGGVPALTGGNGGQKNVNKFDMYRVSAGLKGALSEGWVDGIGWDVAVTYSDSEMDRSGVDTMINRLDAALSGLGGPDCNGIPFGQAGSTCQAYNPFSNSIPYSAPYGYVNPGYIDANANSPEMLNWLIERWNVRQEQSLLVVDGVLDGEIRGFELPGGNIGWAFGGQYRHTEYQARVDNPLANAEITPCPTPGDNSCALPTGPFIFLGQFINQEMNDSVYAVFAEFAIPLLETLDVQLAVRYEDYGGETGDTTDPKLSARWQATEFLALRGSVGSTFRGPTPVNLALRATGLQPVAAAADQYRSIDFTGNPALAPEKADTYSVGFILNLGSFQAIVDYWSYDFKDQITTVPNAAVSNAVGNNPGGGTATGTQLADCGHQLRSLVTFSNNDTCTQGVTVANDMARISSPVVNGPKIETTGVDMSFNYDFGDVLDGVLTAGIDATYVDKYDQDEFTFGGVFIQEAFDAVGYTNYNRVIQTISEWRAIGHVNYGWGPLNTRYEFRYIDGVDDNRSNPSVYNADGDLVEITYGEEVDEYWSHNLYFVWDAPWDTVLTFSIVNMLDEDPSEARHQLGYDPYIGDPLGRTFEIGFTKTFARNN